MLERALRVQGKLYGLKDKIEVTCFDTIDKKSPFEKVTKHGEIVHVGNKYMMITDGEWYLDKENARCCKCFKFDWHTIIDIKSI